MEPNLVDLYRRSSDWAITKIEGANNQLDRTTPCDKWDVRALLNHMLETQQFFLQQANGGQPSFPSAEPPSLIGANPTDDFKQVQAALVEAYAKPEVAEKAGPSLGIAMSDMLLHGCDLARATDQDDTMPDDLAEAAYGIVSPNITDENRKGIFGPEVPVADDASAQEKLLGFSGRQPRR